MVSRRTLLKSAVAAGCSWGFPSGMRAEETTNWQQIDQAANAPLLDLSSLHEPVVLESMELLRVDNEYLVRVRSRSGAEGVIVGNSGWLGHTHPIFQHRVAAYLIGKDMRELDTHLQELLRQNLTYKMQGLALWVCVAAAEMAVLELLGRISGKSIGELFGGVRQREVAVYQASGNRGNAPEEEVEYLQRLVEEIGATALKFRLGGMLSANQDSRPGRSEALIPLVRDAFGDAMTIYADANSSYDAAHAVRIGRMMQEYNYGFLEEPCRFDDLWETKRVADQLVIPIAGGEQESSLTRFRWTIGHRGLDVVQPDLHYFGGYLRTTRVARMAHAAGIPCTPHMSGWGMGYLNAIHLMSYIPNPASHVEFKGYSRIPFHCGTSSMKVENGKIRVPSGPGFGVEIDPDYLRRAVRVAS